MKAHNYIFPVSYAPWLSERLPGSILETQVDCQNCSMVRPHGITRDPGPFLEDLKCWGLRRTKGPFASSAKYPWAGRGRI